MGNHFKGNQNVMPAEKIGSSLQKLRKASTLSEGDMENSSKIFLMLKERMNAKI